MNPLRQITLRSLYVAAVLAVVMLTASALLNLEAKVCDRQAIDSYGWLLEARGRLAAATARRAEEAKSTGDILIWITVTASWYGPGFHGRLTANGEIYDMRGMTFAHKMLPYGTLALFRFGDRYVLARANDRGPFIAGRDVDLSYGAARELGLVLPGVAQIQMAIIKAGRG